MPDTEIDARFVRELADILSDTGLTEFEVERGDLKIRVARQITAAPAQAVTYAAPAAPVPTSYTAPASAPPAPSSAAAPAGEPVKSPMVGTVYLQAKPGDAPFITVGAKVSAGQTLLIIEAMKTMNPVPAPRDGVVAAVLAGDAQPVEFGEPLVILE